MIGDSDELPRATQVVTIATVLAALTSCAPRPAVPENRSAFAPAVVQTDFLLLANDRGASCNFIVKELAAGSAYTRELQAMTVTIGTGPRVGPGKVGVVLTLTRADSSSLRDPLSLVWPVAINHVHFRDAGYSEPDRWPGQPGFNAARKDVWTLPRSPETARNVIESLNTGRVAISYTTLGRSFYANIGPTFQEGGSKPQAYD